MLFWISVGAVTLIVTLLLARALLSGGQSRQHPATYDLIVYRDQLKEVDRDLAKGVISEDEAQRLRTEIGRKILAADAQIAAADADPSATTGPAAMIGIALLVVFIVGGGFFGYRYFGAPGYPDMGLKSRITQAEEARKTRPTQAEAEASLPPTPLNSGDSEYIANLIGQLRQVVASRPDDEQGLRLLSSNEAALGNFKAAYEAQAHLIEVLGDAATADDYVTLGEQYILAAQGYVSPEAEQALTRALRLDATHPVARYYLGLMAAQNGRPDMAFSLWRQLLEEGPSDAPWIAPIRAQIADLADWAGVNYTPPAETGLAGPTAADVQAAGDMTEEDRNAFIRSMVAQLSDRLTTEGGTPQEWARLVSSLGVLGDVDQARAIWEEAQSVFANDPAALNVVQEGARRAGVAE